METKICSKCGVEKLVTQFHSRSGKRKGAPRAACAACANKERAAFGKNVRIEVVAHYGGVCKCCGEHRYEFLEFDHINNDGASHRRSIFGDRAKGTGWKFAEWLRAHNYPTYVQLLCRNCNGAKEYHGECPHEAERRQAQLKIMGER